MKLYNNLSIRTKITAGFILVAIIAVIIGYVGYSSMHSIYMDQENIAENRLPSVKSLLIISEAKTAVGAAENALLSEELDSVSRQAQYDKITAAYVRANEAFKVLEGIPDNGAAEEKLWNDFVANWDFWVNDDTTYITMMKEYDKAPTPELRDKLVLQAYVTNTMSFNAAEKSLNALVEQNFISAKESTNDADTNYAKSSRNLIIISIIVVLVAIFIGLFQASLISKPIQKLAGIAAKIADGDLTQDVEKSLYKDEMGVLLNSFGTMVESLRTLITKITATSQTLASSSEELTATSQEAASVSMDITTTINQLADGATTQAQEMQSISSNMGDVSNSITTASERANDAATASSNVMEIANKGVKVAENAVNKVKSIQRATADTANAVNILGEESQKIGQIVDVIKGIAEQTNLLALNAAIEAARAGELGRGFAVVADEVRKLAEQSNTSAQQISELIIKIQEETKKAVTTMVAGGKEVAEGVEVVTEAGHSFDAIASEIKSVVTQINDISSFINSITKSSDEIARSVDGVASITEETAASSEEISASSEEQSAAIHEVANSSLELAKLAEELQHAVSKFRY